MKRNKIVSFLLVLTMTITFITGCGNSDKSDGAKGNGEKKDGKMVVKILNNKESLCLAPVHIAQVNGYFDEEFKAIGQKYEIVTSNIDTITEQIKQITCQSMASMMTKKAKNPPLLWVPSGEGPRWKRSLWALMPHHHVTHDVR